MSIFRDPDSRVPCIERGNNSLPTCMWGTCEPSTGDCICDPGYIHDYTIGKFDNCGLPDWFHPVFNTIALALASLVSVYGFYVLSRKKARTRTWWLTLHALAANMFFLFTNVGVRVQDGMTIYSGLTNSFGAALVVRCCGILIISAIRPVITFVKLDSTTVDRWEIYLQIILPCLLLISSVICVFTAFLDPGKSNVRMNKALSGYYVCLVGTAIIFIPTIWYFLSGLIIALRQTVSSGKENQSSSKEPTNNDSDNAPGMGRKRLSNPLSGTIKAMRRPSQMVSSIASQGSRIMSPKMSSASVPGGPSEKMKVSTSVPLKQATSFHSSQLNTKRSDVNEKMERLLKKAVLVRGAAVLAAAALVVVALTSVTIQLLSGSLPMSGLVYYAISIGVSAFCGLLIYYSELNTKKESISRKSIRYAKRASRRMKGAVGNANRRLSAAGMRTPAFLQSQSSKDISNDMESSILAESTTNAAAVPEVTDV